MNVAVIGGGPGGYVCAIRLAQLNANVTLFENNKIGGTCLNVGCIPTKALLHVASTYKRINNCSELGININDCSLDLERALKYKNDIVNSMGNGIQSLLKCNGINYINSKATFVSNKTIEYTLDGNKTTSTYDAVVIATGSKVAIPPIPGCECEGVITSNEALELNNLPKSIAIVGGGVIGCEFAEMYSNLGCKVTVIEALPNLLNNLDIDISLAIAKKMKSNKIDVFVNTKVNKIERTDSELCVSVSKDDVDSSICAEKVLIATGRKPNTIDLGLEKIGIETIKGYIPVNFETMETKTTGIYAIGDVVISPQLAHVASSEGVLAAESICLKKSDVDNSIIPSVVYTSPEIASVGEREQSLIENNIAYKVGRFQTSGNARSRIEGDKNGFIKIISNEKDEIIGVHMMCSFASEIISEAALAISKKMKIDEFTNIIYAHPTIYESLKEAAQDIKNCAIHIQPKV